MSMFEIDEAMKIITESVDNDANIIVGQSIHDDYDGEIKITVVATGFDEDSNSTY
jgi:cell division protein FtsZ